MKKGMFDIKSIATIGMLVHTHSTGGSPTEKPSYKVPSKKMWVERECDSDIE